MTVPHFHGLGLGDPASHAVARLTVTMDEISRDAAVASLTSLEGYLSDIGLKLFEIGNDWPNINVGDLIAFRTDNLRVTLEPSERYRTLVAALAAGKVEGLVVNVEQSHGWPILSSMSGSTTMAEGRVVSSDMPQSAGGPK